MKISKEFGEGLKSKFLLDKTIFGEGPTNARKTQASVVPQIVYWNMDAIKGWEANKPTFIKGESAEDKFDHAP